MSADKRSSALEKLPKWLLWTTLIINWLWLSLRFRSLTLPSVTNPRIPAGGLVGEGKMDYFAAMGADALELTAPFCAIQNSTKIPVHSLTAAMAGAGVFFPVMAKPDLGMCGYGVRKVSNVAELLWYLSVFPHGEIVVLQNYLPGDIEAGIFYARRPGEHTGQVIGVALRQRPQIVGDGHRCLRALIAADPRAGRACSSTHDCGSDLMRIPAAGEVVYLANIGSVRVGGLYRDGSNLITQQLTAAVEQVARAMPDFHFGRFDVRCSSLHELSAGAGFTIMEVNGAGSEAIHAWDPDLGLSAALRMIFSKQRLGFEIGNELRRAGHRPLGILALAKLYRRQMRLIASYPPST